MKNLYEIILKEDMNNFIEWGTETIQKKVSAIDSNINAKNKLFQNLLRNIYILAKDYNEINAKEVLILYLNGMGNPRINRVSNVKYFLKIIKLYEDLIDFKPKRYGIKLKKISRNQEFKDINDIVEYIRETASKIKDIIKSKNVKKKNKDDRMADKFLYEDDDVKISLFTEFDTAKKTFEGISNWCITKNPKDWNQYTKFGILVLFNNKKVKYRNRNETPLAFVCNLYKIKDNEFKEIISYDMEDNKLSSSNFTRKYSNIVEKKCRKLFGGDLDNWKNVVDTDILDSRFFLISSDKLINGKVITRDMVFLGKPYHYYDIGVDEFREEDYEKFVDAEYYGGLQISSANFNKVNFPNISYISSFLELYNFTGNITIDENDLSSIRIGRETKNNTGVKNIEFKDDLILKEFDIPDEINNFSIKCKNEMAIDEFTNYGYLFGFDSFADTEFSYDKESNNYKIESLSRSGELKINNMRRHSQYINIKNYDMVHFYIDKPTSINISKYIFEDVEEVHFFIKEYDRFAEEIMEHIKEKKDPSLDDAEVFFHED